MDMHIDKTLFFILVTLCINLVSKIFIQKLFNFLILLVRNRTLASYLLAIIFLPGTIIHELSHLLTAKFLFVPVGSFNIFPRVLGNEIKLGSVMIAKTDLLRESIIGIAPLAVGLVIIYYTSTIPFTLITAFIIFQIANTMFLSRSDLNAPIKLTILTIIIVALINYWDAYIKPIITNIIYIFN